MDTENKTKITSLKSLGTVLPEVTDEEVLTYIINKYRTECAYNKLNKLKSIKICPNIFDIIKTIDYDNCEYE